MRNETENPDTSRQQDDSKTTKTREETTVNRIAKKAARQGVQRQQRYDREHNIFTK
jgi:hypothetical protein